jgi:CheY-like chemotaxis protein
MSVLIVEDNRVSAKMLELKLKKSGYDVVVVPTGVDALDRLENDGAIELVITDIMMPEMDGLELLKRMKEVNRLKSIPVIMCTSKADEKTVKAAAVEGCVHYFLKPIDIDSLLKKVNSILNNNIPVLRDKYSAMQKLGLDTGSYMQVLNEFTSLVSSTLKKLDTLDDDTTGPVDIANLLEGATLVGAERMKAVLEEMHGRLKNGELDSKDYDYSLLQRELHAVKMHLDSTQQ